MMNLRVRPGLREKCIPIGEVETVVDGLDAGRIDSIYFDAMLTNEFGDGKDSVGKACHEAIGDFVFTGPENSHVSAAPDELGF